MALNKKSSPWFAIANIIPSSLLAQYLQGQNVSHILNLPAKPICQTYIVSLLKQLPVALGIFFRVVIKKFKLYKI